MIQLLAQEVTTKEVGNYYGGLIFMGLFFLALMIVGIWWLRR